MKKEILKKIYAHTEEETEILQGRTVIDRRLYTDDAAFVIDRDKFLLPGQLICVRKHTRFIDFPLHTHNYVELLYVYHGSMTQVIGGREITMKEGELMVLDQAISHEIRAAGERDIVINFIIRPEFFRYLFSLAEMEDNAIFRFIMNAMYNGGAKGEYLYYKVSGQGAVKSDMDKIITELYQPDIASGISLQFLVGLLLIKLIRHSEDIEVYSADTYEKKLSLEVLKYIAANYKDGSLAAVSKQLNQPDYRVSRIVKKITGCTFLQLVQQSRLNQAAELLRHTDLTIAEIMQQVGYENITFFYKLFKEKYQQTPRTYRQNRGE